MSDCHEGQLELPHARVVGSRAASRSYPAACEDLGIVRPLIVTDSGLRDSPMIRQAVASLPMAKLFADVRGNPVAANVEAGLKAYHAGDARWRRRLRRRLGSRRRQGHRLHVGADAPAVGLRGHRRLVDARRSQGHRADGCRAHHCRHGQRSGARRRHPQRRDPSEEDHLPPEDDAGHRHRGSGAHGRTASRRSRPPRASTPSCIASRRSARRASIRWPTASRSKACGSSRPTCRAPARTAATWKRARACSPPPAWAPRPSRKGSGAVHAIAHPVGSFFDTHHGLTNAVITPYVIVHNREAIAERMKVVARVLDLPKPGVDGVLAWVLDFRKELGIPHSLAEIGVTLRNPEEIGREAAIDPSAGGNPIPVDARHARAHLPLGGEGRSVAQELAIVARILVIDGNETATRAKHVSVGGTDSGEGYAATLKRLKPGIECDIVRPADEEPKLPEGVALGDYRRRGDHRLGAQYLFARSVGGAADRSRQGGVRSRCALFRQLLGPAGGRHGRGRQRGAQSARPRVRIRATHQLTRQGRDHAMFRGKPEVFEAVHRARRHGRERCPPDRHRLAHNDMGLQAAEIRLTTARPSGACSTTRSTASPRLPRPWRAAMPTC